MAFEIYKAGQGERVRNGLALIAGILLCFGCYSLYSYLSGFPSLERNFTKAFGEDVAINWSMLISAAVFLGGSVVLYRLYNRPTIADFLIETEAELHKVTWSTKREVINHSIVVIVTVIVLGVYIAGIDAALYGVFVKLVWKAG